MDEILQTVKKNLPTPGTELAGYTFLGQDALRTGTVESRHPFVVVAEYIWPFGGGGLFLIVMEDGSVQIAQLDGYNGAWAEQGCGLDLSSDSLVGYCAADFQKFTEIMQLYLTVLEFNPIPETFDVKYYEKCAETAEILRQQIQKIDPTALQNTESFWSVIIEEFGYGM